MERAQMSGRALMAQRQRDLIETNAPGEFDDFFDLDITAVGDKLTLKANDKVVYSIDGSSVGYGMLPLDCAGIRRPRLARITIRSGRDAGTADGNRFTVGLPDRIARSWWHANQ